jgi:hypothetical protein
MVVVMMMIIIIIMSMAWDYVSELRSPTGLLLIPQDMCEHKEPWRNDTDMEKVIRPQDLSGSPTSSII